MGAAEDIEAVEGFYALWASEGLAGIGPSLHDEAMWIPHPQAPEPGPFRGRDEVIRVAVAYTRGFGRYRPVPQRILAGAAPGEVLGLATYATVGREGGQEFTMPVGHLFEVRDGKVARFEEIPNLAEALAAAGVDPLEDPPPTRVEAIALTLVAAIEEGDSGLALAMVAGGAELDAPCEPAAWADAELEAVEVLGREDRALVIATVAEPGEGSPRTVAAEIEADFMGLISRLTFRGDAESARREFEAG